MFTDQQLVIHNFEDKLRGYTYAVDGELTSEADFTIANINIPTNTFNVLLPKALHINQNQKLRDNIDQFPFKGHPFSVWIDTRYLSSDWIDFMQDYDLKETEKNIMMKRDNTLSLNYRLSDQLLITQVNKETDLAGYMEVFISLFEEGLEKEAVEKYFEMFSQFKLDKNVQMFVGYVGDDVVTTGSFIESKDSYGIYDLMTKEAFREKGYGSEMFQHLLHQTINKQKPVVLQASVDGVGIYKRFGFTEVGEMLVFE